MVLLGLIALIIVFFPPIGGWLAVCPNQPMSTVVADAEGKLISATVAQDGQWRFPANGQLPYKYQQALLLAEDRHFYSHPGFNPFSVFRAILINVQNGTVKQGGSTITQQSIRISRQNPSRNLIEKVIELLLAFRWEVWATKDEILQFYTAHTPMGGNTVGYSAACWRYFRKIPSEITWAQAATLSVLPNSPGQIHPGKAREVLLRKRNNLLKKILQSKLIDSAAFYRSINEELIQSPQAFPQLAPHLLAYLSETKGSGKWYSTSVDASLQANLGALLDDIRPEKEAKQINNVGLVVIRLKDQRVVAYQGNYPNTVNSPFVDLVQAKRSYGSLLKPFLYATALADGKITPQGWLEDVPKTYEGSYSPKNFNNKYQGVVPADIALAHSLNIPFVNMQRSLGTYRFLKVLNQLGLKSLNRTPSYYGLSLVLGGGEVSLWEMLQAYTLLANGCNPVRKPLLKNGIGVLLNDTTPKIKLKQLPWSDAIVWHTQQAMTIADRPDMDLALRLMLDQKNVAWKTGTSWGLRDAWCIGFNQDYLVGVWLGNANSEGVNGLTGIRQAAPIMFRVLELLPNETPPFHPPMGWEKHKICATSNLIASPYCDSTVIAVLPKCQWHKTSICHFHKRLFTDPQKHFQLTQNCATNIELKASNYLVLPPALAYYYAQSHFEYRSPPPFRPDCSPKTRLEILYPKDKMVIFAPNQTFVAKAYSSQQTALLWLLDGEPIGTTESIHKMQIPAAVGFHQLTLVGDEITNVQFEIRP